MSLFCIACIVFYVLVGNRIGLHPFSYWFEDLFQEALLHFDVWLVSGMADVGAGIMW